MTPQERAILIKDALRERNIRQYAIARSLGVSDSSVNRCINGTRSSARIARAISVAVGQSFEALFPETAALESRRALLLIDSPDSVRVDPAEVDALRKTVKKRLIDLDLDRSGSYDAIIPRMRIPATRNTISMALTGYRRGSAAMALLREIQTVLSDWPREAA